VVPSPEPKQIVELEAVRDLVNGGALVVCSGGGGVPVVRSRGALSGIDAVIDKDLAAALLAKELGADALLILTDVPQAYVHYGTPEQEALSRVTASQMRAYAAEGHFKAGSMGPKVEACLRFVDAGGESVIASLIEVGPAMAGRAGTHIVPDAPAKAKRGAGPAAKPAAKSTGKAAGTKKAAARKQPAKRERRDSSTSDGADVIDITTARRRAAAD
jgi:carbamate kinase